MSAADPHAKMLPASLWRRFAAMLYDSVLIIGLLFIASVPVVLLNGGAIGSDTPLKHALFMFYLASVAFLFHGWFWTHGGQTLGMAAWRIRIVTTDNRAISWRAALIRWITACLGLANLACLINHTRRSWHEYWSASYTVYQPRS